MSDASTVVGSACNGAMLTPLPARNCSTTAHRTLTNSSGATTERLSASTRCRTRHVEYNRVTWVDIDLPNALLHVRRSLKLEDGRLVIDERLKTTRSRRTLSLPHPVLDALAEQRRLQDQLAESAGYANSDGPVFTTSKGTPHSPENLRRSLATLTTKLGYGNWHPHELRHTAASLMSQAGVPIETIADQLGHDGTRMTLLVYRHQTKPSVTAAHHLTDLLADQPEPAPQGPPPDPNAASARPATRRSKRA